MIASVLIIWNLMVFPWHIFQMVEIFSEQTIDEVLNFIKGKTNTNIY